jgi:hypothetical protein
MKQPLPLFLYKETTEMNKISFGIIGGGMRAEFYIRIAKALPDRFNICGIVVRNKENAEVLNREWGVKTFSDIQELISSAKPDFVIVCVTQEKTPEFIRQLAEKNIPVLSETPPAPDLESLIELNTLTREGAKIQVAEQWHLLPKYAAILSIVESGIIGEVTHVQVSACHGYHGVSLIRKLLGLKFENARITAKRFISPIMESPYRIDTYIPKKNKIVDSKQTLAIVDFNKKTALLDFTEEQYTFWTRKPNILVRGVKGEIRDKIVTYLKDHETVIESEIKRIDTNEYNYFYHVGYLLGNNWVYRNPFIPQQVNTGSAIKTFYGREWLVQNQYKRMTDDEIATATILEKMAGYVRNGSGFYGLAEASQDHYLGIMINEAIKKDEVVKTQFQKWTTNI